MKGFVPTPEKLVDLMVDKLFRDRVPGPGASLLDPGCGTGPFIDGVLRWCKQHRVPPPSIVGVELDDSRARQARERFAHIPNVAIRSADFLASADGEFDYIIGNPPYVAIDSLTVEERHDYRSRFKSAVGRFDLYMLFYEQALNVLAPGGRLVFVTPEKFLYVSTASRLRQLLADRTVEELHLLPEDSFGELVTYPLVATISAGPPAAVTRVTRRSESETAATLRGPGSWLPALQGAGAVRGSELTALGDVCARISCGVATGADSVFVVKEDTLPADLEEFAYRTVAGRQLIPGKKLATSHVMLLPYARNGSLIPEEGLGALGAFLRETESRAQLNGRTCVTHKPWYAFHETPPLEYLLRPKLLCKDIGESSAFWADLDGDIIPRHSVYYVVPRLPSELPVLLDYLNSREAATWFRQNCQRAAKGYLRLQSHVLKRLPLPPGLVASTEGDLFRAAI